LLARQGDVHAAVEAYEHALRHRPGWASAECNLGVAYATLGRFKEAVELYRLAQQRRPDWPEIAYNLANALADSGRLPEAVEQYRKAISLRPAYADAHDHLGIVLSRLGRPDQAVDRWKEALRIDPARHATRNRLVMGLCEVRRYAQAIAVLREGLRLRPGDLAYANNLAWLLATSPHDDVRRGAEAVALAQRVCRAAREDNAAFLDSLAAAYAETGHFDRAVEVAKRALQMARKEGEAARAGQLAERLKLYRQGRPFRQKH
jgi:tetratricopeptide (TPR) repeat protein